MSAPSVHFDPFAMLVTVRCGGGFLVETEVDALANCPTSRLWPLLVRCGGGRFTAPAQDVAHFVSILGREGSDYVRDVSLVAGYDYR